MGREIGSGGGTVYKRGDKWRGQVTVNGKRISFTAKKRREVLDWLSEVRIESKYGTLVDANDITVKEFAELWLANVVEKSVSPQSLYKTQNLFENHLYPYLGSVKVQDLTTRMIQDAYPEMFKNKGGKKYKNCNYSDGTIRIFSNEFKALLKYAVSQKIIKTNPHEGVAIKKNKNIKVVDAYTEDEQRKIVQYTRNRTDANCVFYFLLATGMRIGEALALTWDDVDLKNKCIYVNKTAINYKGHMIIQDHPKTEQSVRTIYFSNKVYLFLKRLLKTMDNKNRRNLVFYNEKYNVYHTSALRSRWIKSCAEMNIPYRGIHALRHTWATRAIEHGVDIKTVSEMLGHSSVITTLDIYQDVQSAHKKQAANIMNAVL